MLNKDSNNELDIFKGQHTFYIGIEFFKGKQDITIQNYSNITWKSLINELNILSKMYNKHLNIYVLVPNTDIKRYIGECYRDENFDFHLNIENKEVEKKKGKSENNVIDYKITQHIKEANKKDMSKGKQDFDYSVQVINDGTGLYFNGDCETYYDLIQRFLKDENSTIPLRIIREEWKSKYNEFIAYDYEPFTRVGFNYQLTIESIYSNYLLYLLNKSNLFLSFALIL